MTANASRLRARIESVRCEVAVVRDDFQAEAADKMKQKMAELVSAIETESEGATEKLQLYINCCSREEGQVLILMMMMTGIPILNRNHSNLKQTNYAPVTNALVIVIGRKTFTYVFNFQARDCSFERLLLSCASDDQKAVKSRLMHMKEFVDRTTESSNAE